MQPNYKIIRTGNTITISCMNGMVHNFSEGYGFREADALIRAVDTATLDANGVEELALRIIANVGKLDLTAKVKDQTADMVLDNIEAAKFLKSIGVERNEYGDIQIGTETIEEDSPLLGVILSLLVDGTGQYESKKNFLTKILNSHFDVEQITQICNFMLGNGDVGTNDYNINEEGNFILYRAVDYHMCNVEDMYYFADRNTGKVPQPVGWTITMPATLVDKDPNNTCSHGLHIATLYYAKECFSGYRSVVHVVEVDPRDIISVPTDYSFQKIRATKYKILEIYDPEEEHDFLDESYLPEHMLLDETEVTCNGTRTITVGRHGKVLKVDY